MEIKIHCIIRLKAVEFPCHSKRNRSDKTCDKETQTNEDLLPI